MLPELGAMQCRFCPLYAEPHFIMQHCLCRGSRAATTQASVLYNGAFLNQITAENYYREKKNQKDTSNVYIYTK